MVMTCDTCKQTIEGKSITAMGKNYHPNHFTCVECKQPITDTTFHQRDGKPLCQSDYEKSCPLCDACAKPILLKKVTAMGRNFHPEHFTCKLCMHAISDAEYHEKDGGAVCHACFLEKVADKCKNCGEAISSTATIALGAKWHPDCFKCNKCNTVISSGKFKVTATGHPLCEGC